MTNAENHLTDVDILRYPRQDSKNPQNKPKYERRAGDFAHSLLVNEQEAMFDGLATWEWSEYFRVPDRVLWL